MGVTCPDKRLSSWKNLVKIQGENISYFLYNEYSGNVPEKYYNSTYNKETQYQKQTNSNEGIIAAEKTIRDLAARMADRTGMKVKFESDRSKDYKGKIENNTAVINLANATLDTPIHEVLGHSIIRAIKRNKKYKNTDEEFLDGILDSPQGEENPLYQNLLKELEYGKGKEVLDRIKRDYNKKLIKGTEKDLENLKRWEQRLKENPEDEVAQTWYNEISKKIKYGEYTLEEQQEEAIVELLGLMTAEKLDAVKDGKLISLLKRLLKEIKSFVKDLLKQREVKIDKLPDNMTLGDLSDLLAYSNSKLILPGYEVEYTTPDNMKFKTYSEASKHISELAKSVKDIDLSNINLKDRRNIKLPNFFQHEIDKANIYKKDGKWIYQSEDDVQEITEEEAIGYYLSSQIDETETIQSNIDYKNSISNFIEKNKEYEQSKEIIEEWKKVNNIQYNPEEVYSRGQEFSSVVGAYSSFDVNLMMQNLLQHIEDNEKAGGKFAISAFTKPVDKTIGHLEGGGGKIKFKIYPKSDDILWAANSDVFSGSVWDASEKVNKDKKPELLGVSYTKYPSLNQIDSVQPNLASIIDNLNYHHNELGIVLTGNNFRLEYDEDIPYSTKKIIDGINSILDQKYGKLVKSEIRRKKLTKEEFQELKNLQEAQKQSKNLPDFMDETDLFTEKDQKRLIELQSLKGIQPTQTNETLKESIRIVKNKIGIIELENIGNLDLFNNRKQEEFNIILKFGKWYIQHTDSQANYNIVFSTEQDAKTELLKLLKYSTNKKEYTSRALINTKIAKLKEVAKKYPRSLIRSEVRPQMEGAYYRGVGDDLFEPDESPFQKVPSKTPVKQQRGFVSEASLPLKGAESIYSYYNLLSDDNSIKEISMSDSKEIKAAYKWVDTLNLSPYFKFKLTNRTIDEKWRIFIIDEGVKTKENIQRKLYKEEPFTPLAEDLSQTNISNQVLEDNSSEMFRLPTADYQENLESLDNKLIDILQRKYGMTVNIVDALKTRLNTDALGFTKLLTGTAEINIRTYRDRMTVPEEAAHIFMAMLDGTPLYNRLINWLGKEDYYKKVLDNEYEQYNELYKGNVNKLKIEAAGKLLGQTFITRNVIPPVQVKSLLERIWDAIKRLVGKFPINEIERELNILTNEISDAALNEKMDSIQGSTENIKPFVEEDLSILYQVGNKIKTEQQLKDQTLTSIAKRIQYFKRTGQDKKIAKYQQLEEEYNKFIDDGNYLKGIGLYLQTLSEEKKGFNKGLKQIKQSFNNPEREDLKSVAKNLRQMHTVINNNSSTLANLIDLFGDFLYDSDYEFKAEAKELKKASEKMLSYFNRLEKDYIRIGLQVTAEMMAPLLGKRNDTDVLADLNRNRPANKQLSILNLEEALLKGDTDINFINRWLDAVAEVPDDLLKILDVAIKNQKIESQQETLEDKKVLLDAQDKLKESTEFIVEKIDGKLTGNIITEVDWGLMQKKESDFFKQLNTEVKSKYGYEYKDFMSRSDELMKKFGQAEYITDRQNYKKQIAKLFSTTRLSDEEIAKELEGKSDIWKHFNTETNEDGRLIIPRTKSKSFQDIQSNPNQLEYYNVVTNLMYELDSLLPEQKRLGRKLPQIRKDFVERLKMAIKDKSTEAYASIFKELQENFQVLEDEDRRGMKFELSDDGITPIKFLPIYYVNRLSNPNEISTDITSSLTIFSSMARDYGKMNEIIDLMEIARDVINVRDIVRTDSKGNPEVESVKTAKSKLLRTLFIPQGTSRMADLLHDFYNMQIYGELEKEEKIAGTNLDRAKIIDALTRYAALNMLSLNVFSGFQNVVTGVSQEKIDSVAKEFISFDALKFADSKYYGLKNFSNLLGSVGSVDGRNPVTGEHSELILWGEKFDVMQDFKSENKELDSSRKTAFGRLFKTSTLMFIQKSGENWLNMRTSLALAHEYRYNKDLEGFVWREDFYMPLRKLEYKRKDEIKQLSGEDIKGKIETINNKYKQEESTLKEKLDKSWREMTNYYDAHEKIGRRLKLKSEFKENKEDVQAFIKKTNFLNKRFHGIYNDADKSAAQQFALFRVVNLFRKFMVPFWNRRYGKTQFNYEGQAWTEGYYITVFNFIKNIIMESRAGEYSLRKNWATLSELEKANFKRAMMDAGQVLGMMVIAMILGLVAEGGDDDEWALQMALYIANRSITELGAFTPSPLMLSEGLRTIQSPTAAITPLKRIADLMQPWEWNNEIERGRYKGWTKGEKLLYQSVPALNKLKDVSSPAEMMVFYN